MTTDLTHEGVTVRQRRTFGFHFRSWRVECGDPRCGRVGSFWTWETAIRWANAHALAHRYDGFVLFRGSR